ncbi:MAG: hypothetical protein IV100_00870 [Myxococcales bacterium]|nr:hypothetical protein [Myxococcales bacterium]
MNEQATLEMMISSKSGDLSDIFQLVNAIMESPAFLPDGATSFVDAAGTLGSESSSAGVQVVYRVCSWYVQKGNARGNYTMIVSSIADSIVVSAYFVDTAPCAKLREAVELHSSLALQLLAASPHWTRGSSPVLAEPLHATGLAGAEALVELVDDPTRSVYLVVVPEGIAKRGVVEAFQEAAMGTIGQMLIAVADKTAMAPLRRRTELPSEPGYRGVLMCSPGHHSDGEAWVCGLPLSDRLHGGGQRGMAFLPRLSLAFAFRAPPIPSFASPPHIAARAHIAQHVPHVCLPSSHVTQEVAQ